MKPTNRRLNLVTCSSAMIGSFVSSEMPGERQTNVIGAAKRAQKAGGAGVGVKKAQAGPHGPGLTDALGVAGGGDPFAEPLDVAYHPHHQLAARLVIESKSIRDQHVTLERGERRPRVLALHPQERLPLDDEGRLLA